MKNETNCKQWDRRHRRLWNLNTFFIFTLQPSLNGGQKQKRKPKTRTRACLVSNHQGMHCLVGFRFQFQLFQFSHQLGFLLNLRQLIHFQGVTLGLLKAAGLGNGGRALTRSFNLEISSSFFCRARCFFSASETTFGCVGAAALLLRAPRLEPLRK